MRTAILTAARSPVTAIERVARGLEWADADFVAKALGVSLERFAELTGIPSSTFFRRQEQDRFSVNESEHIMRFARLWDVASEVFPSGKAARSWLSRSQYGLEGAIPLNYAKTELGARVVEDLMMRIHHGVLA